MRKLIAAIVAAGIFAQAANAQQRPGPAPSPSEAEKARNVAKQKFMKATDEEYQATITRIPDAQKKADPWGNLRGPDK